MTNRIVSSGMSITRQHREAIIAKIKTSFARFEKSIEDCLIHLKCEAHPSDRVTCTIAVTLSHHSDLHAKSDGPNIDDAIYGANERIKRQLRKVIGERNERRHALHSRHIRSNKV